eukprot:5599494-Pleurochrysis_carterae.AAC.1
MLVLSLSSCRRLCTCPDRAARARLAAASGHTETVTNTAGDSLMPSASYHSKDMAGPTLEAQHKMLLTTFSRQHWNQVLILACGSLLMPSRSSDMPDSYWANFRDHKIGTIAYVRYTTH